VSYARRKSFDEPNNSKLIVFIQANSHIELLKFSNVLLHPEILLARGGNLKIELLLVQEGENLFSMCFLSLYKVLILDLALFFFKVLYHKEAYPFNLGMTKLKAFSSLYFLTSMILLIACT